MTDWGTLSDKAVATEGETATLSNPPPPPSPPIIDQSLPELPPETDHETFVWVLGLRGPSPQAWGKDYYRTAMTGGPRDNVLMKVEKLTGIDRRLGLDELALKYPLPVSLRS